MTNNCDCNRCDCEGTESLQEGYFLNVTLWRDGLDEQQRELPTRHPVSALVRCQDIVQVFDCVKFRALVLAHHDVEGYRRMLMVTEPIAVLQSALNNTLDCIME